MSEPGNSSVLFARVPAVGNRKALRDFSQRLSREVAGGRRFTCLITRDAELQRMNSAFLGKDEPTDVLSFPASEDPTGWLGEIAISADRAQVQAAVHAIGQVAGDSYLQLMEQSRPCFEGIFNLLADPQHYPSAFYCAAGKDRTGMVSALLLRVLGVSDEQIIEDYALTAAPSEERLIARFKAMGRDLSRMPDPASLRAHPETMEHFLAGFDRSHGSVEEFLMQCNVDDRTLQRVRENLLEG